MSREKRIQVVYPHPQFMIALIIALITSVSIFLFFFADPFSFFWWSTEKVSKPSRFNSTIPSTLNPTESISPTLGQLQLTTPTPLPTLTETQYQELFGSLEELESPSTDWPQALEEIKTNLTPKAE